MSPKVMLLGSEEGNGKDRGHNISPRSMFINYLHYIMWWSRIER